MTDTQTFVIIGAGQAGAWIAKTLRAEGFTGRVVLIGEEFYLPYERPPLSKTALAGETDIHSAYFWQQEIYDSLDIEVLTGARVIAIDRVNKKVALDNGEGLAYDRLAIATGSRVRTLPVPGVDLTGVHYMRNINDMLAIKANIQDQTRVLIVGGGWIGLEIAATLSKLGYQPVIVELSDRLCARVVPPDISSWLLTLHQTHGIEVRLNTSVERFEGAGSVERAVLSNGETIKCGLVVIGIGVLPNSEIAESAGLTVNNGVVVDELCRTSDPHVFAAGDVTNHPSKYLDRSIRLESWENAQNQGIAAGKSMLDKGEAYNEIPWFWSDQYDANIQLLGIPEDWDEVATRGDPKASSFLTMYLKEGIIIGAIAVNNARDIRVVKRLMATEKVVPIEDLKNADLKMQALLKAK